MSTPVRTERAVNLVAIVVLLAGGVLLGGGVHLLHGHQVKRNAHALLAQADLAEEEGRSAQVADYLAQYLGFAPDDLDAAARLGLLLDRQARSPRERLRPFFLLDRVLTRDPSRAGVRRQVIRIATELGRFSDARHHLAVWGELARRRPDDLAVRVQLIEYAYREGREADLTRLVEEVQRIEGTGGAVTAYGAGALELLKARKANSSLAEGKRRLGQAAALRPSWPAVLVPQAEADEREGRPEKALERYQAALERGEGRLGVVRRMVDLLGRQGRYAEAQALLRRVPEAMQSASGLDRVGAQLTLLGTDGEGEDKALARRLGLEAARKAVGGRADYRDHLWLGQMCLLAGEQAEAEKAFRRARDLAEDNPDAWAHLVLLLIRTDPKKAEAELASARKRLPRERQVQILPLGYEALGRLEEAEQQHRAALKDRPNDPAVLWAAAGFYGRTGRAARAEPLLRRLLEPGTAEEAMTARARRALAVNLAMTGNYKQFKEARELLPERKGEPAEDRQARALVLASRPEHRREAIELLAGLSAGRTRPPAEVRLLLAQLYEASGDWPRARVHLQTVAQEQDRNPLYLAAYVRALLRHKQAEQAAEWVERLAKLNRPGFEAVELRARVLHARGLVAEARDLVKQYARTPGGLAGAVLDAARLLDDLDQAEEAEKLYRAHLAASKDPRARLPLADHLARRGRTAEALGLCEKAWRDCPPELVAQTCARVARLPRGVTEAQRERVRRWLAAKDPRSLLLPVLLAELEDWHGRHEQAIALYRQAQRLTPRARTVPVVVLNNLAYLLAFQEGQQREALELIEAAITEAGPHPALLDTRAVVHLQAGRAEEALKDLRQALLAAPSAPRYLHLAEAQRLAKNRPAALEAYRRAEGPGFRPADLHPLDRELLGRLKRELE